MTSLKFNSAIGLGIMAASILIAPSAAMAMRCGTSLVTEGDTQDEVLRNCGEPSQTTSRYITRGSSFSSLRAGDTLSGRHRGDYYFTEEVLVEEWIFNLGPNKLRRKVTFENGIVVDVDTLDYGYNE